MSEIKFIPLTYSNDTKAYVRADAIVQLVEGVDKTFVYIVSSDAPMMVKESVDEILYDLSIL